MSAPATGWVTQHDAREAFVRIEQRWQAPTFLHNELRIVHAFIAQHPTAPSPTDWPSEEAVERAAKAICVSRGLNPDCLHDDRYGEYPTDEKRRDYTGTVVSQYRAWRKQVPHARAALAAAPSPQAEAEPTICDDCRQSIVGPAFCYQCVEHRTDERGAASRRIALEQSNALVDKIVRDLEITSSGVDMGADKNPTDYAKGVAKGWDDAVNALKRAVQAQRSISTLLALNEGERKPRPTDLGRFA